MITTYLGKLDTNNMEFDEFFYYIAKAQLARKMHIQDIQEALNTNTEE